MLDIPEVIYESGKPYVDGMRVLLIPMDDAKGR